MSGQRPQRGYLGVGLQPLDEDVAPSLGIPKDSGEIVRSVVPNGPAARGGLVQGDVIVRVNGQPVTPDQTVSYLVANTGVGSRVPLEILRGGKRATVTSRWPSGRPKKRSRRSAAAARTTRHCPGRARRAAESAWLVACTSDAGARARGEPSGDHSRSDHHRRRPQRRRGREGPAAPRPRRLGQQSAGDRSCAGGCCGRCGAQGGPLERAPAGQARGRRPRPSSASTSPASNQSPSAALALRLRLGKGNGRR